MTQKRQKTKIILALDTTTVEEGLTVVEKVGPSLEYVKVGPRHFYLGGWELIEKLQKMSKKVFLDLKLHDIPNTVALGVDVIARKGLWALSIHMGGGSSMAKRALEARNDADSSMLLLGISVLTSIDQASWNEVVPARGDVRQAVLARGNLAAQVGMDGLVCSLKEVQDVRNATGSKLQLVVPGIRPTPGRDDQKRIATPGNAAKGGADYLVIGRPIYGAADPAAAFRAIEKDIEEVLS